MRYFDYQAVAREAKIPEQKLRKLVDLIGKEFPSDSMDGRAPRIGSLPSHT
jgi:hypothetical protein